MTKTFNDPLLAIARILTLVGQAIMVVTGSAMLVALVAINIFRQNVLAELAVEFPDLALDHPIAMFSVLLVIAIAFVAIGWFFLKKLRQIIDTVAVGDPFVPENGRRLAEMGWLALAGQILSLPATAIGLHVRGALQDAHHIGITPEINVDASGILLVVTLFILARVFRQGAAMREDLEGTV